MTIRLWILLVLSLAFASGCSPDPGELEDDGGADAVDSVDDDLDDGGGDTVDPDTDEDTEVEDSHSDIDSDVEPDVVRCESVQARNETDVSYLEVDGVDPDLLSLDVYAPEWDGCDTVPIVVWIHGGGWAVGDKANHIDDKVDWLRGELGYVLISVNYRLSPSEESEIGESGRVVHPTHVQDVAAALDWIADNGSAFGGDTEQVAVLGHSAGAHLAALVATDEGYLEAQGRAPTMIDCVGSYDTEAYDIPAKMESAGARERAIVTNAFGDDEQVWAEASPINHVDAAETVPPFQLVRRGTSERRRILSSFETALSNAGVSVDVIEASGSSHAEVNQFIGAPGDDVMSPGVGSFLSGVCFAP